eukprot:scaffold8503_cov296-Pinguiococcus_pyrenoidosus.AAC.1
MSRADIWHERCNKTEMPKRSSNRCAKFHYARFLNVSLPLFLCTLVAMQYLAEENEVEPHGCGVRVGCGGFSCDCEKNQSWGARRARPGDAEERFRWPVEGTMPQRRKESHRHMRKKGGPDGSAMHATATDRSAKHVTATDGSGKHATATDGKTSPPNSSIHTCRTGSTRSKILPGTR